MPVGIRNHRVGPAHDVVSDSNTLSSSDHCTAEATRMADANYSSSAQCRDVARPVNSSPVGSSGGPHHTVIRDFYLASRKSPEDWDPIELAALSYCYAPPYRREAHDRRANCRQEDLVQAAIKKVRQPTRLVVLIGSMRMTRYHRLDRKSTRLKS